MPNLLQRKNICANWYYTKYRYREGRCRCRHRRAGEIYDRGEFVEARSLATACRKSTWSYYPCERCGHADIVSRVRVRYCYLCRKCQACREGESVGCVDFVVHDYREYGGCCLNWSIIWPVMGGWVIEHGAHNYNFNINFKILK
jgi:hypothetical protein